MKFTIEITGDAVTKTLSLGEKNYTQTMIKKDRGCYITTGPSIATQLEEDNADDELIDSIDFDDEIKLMQYFKRFTSQV